MPRRDDSGRFVSEDDDDRYGRSFGSRGRSREYDDFDDDRRGTSRRGFASMDPDRQREISSMGGRASHGGQGRDWEDRERYGRSDFGGSRGRARESDWEDDYEDRRGMSGRSETSGRSDWRGEERDYGTGRSMRGQSRDWEDDDRERDRYGRFTSGGGYRGRSQQFDDYDDDDDRRGTSRRGFASMDPERQREIASMGGRASHGGRGREDDDDRDRDRYGRFTSGGRGRSRYEEEDDDRGRSSSRRGFASMDPEEHRRISRMGGHASHGGR